MDASQNEKDNNDYDLNDFFDACQSGDNYNDNNNNNNNNNNSSNGVIINQQAINDLILNIFQNSETHNLDVGKTNGNDFMFAIINIIRFLEIRPNKISFSDSLEDLLLILQNICEVLPEVHWDFIDVIEDIL
ncbi:hypothetical protein ACTFIY_009480 [Dictyostelium cf. discoideum]